MPVDGPSRDPRSALPAAIAAATSSDELDTALASILRAGIDALQPTMAAVVLADPDRPGLTLGAVHGLTDTEPFVAAIQERSHPFSQVVTGRRPIFDWEALTPDGTSFVGAYVPLLVARGGVETAIGALGLYWTAPHELTEDERAVVTALAGVAALAVDRARLSSTAAERSEWFERMAHTDPLTGLANERTVARILELEVARAARQGSEVSLAIFDIDDFRSANATDGHEVGDDMLRRVAAVLAETVRLVDTVGRIGGDEFVLVAPGSAGALVARRVLDGIAALPAVAGRVVSVSAGVALFPVDGTDPEALIAAATAALERAKRSGAGSVAASEAVAEG